MASVHQWPDSFASICVHLRLNAVFRINNTARAVVRSRAAVFSDGR
jgi:hypothetical protein